MNTVPDTTPNNASVPSVIGVPLLDLGRQYRTIQQEMNAALTAVCDSGQFVLGPEVTRLEHDIASYCQTKHAIGCASGSDALLLALMALDVGPGDEVILPSFTFFATASAVTRLHARPVFADIDAETYNIDPLIVRRLVNRNTKAIIPVHLFGQCAAMNAICRIGRSDSVPIIEDAAQSIGAEFDGQRAGSIGDLGCLSFYPTKNLGGAGDGGMLTTSSDALAQRLRLLRGHGMEPRYYHRIVGVNSRLDSFQAAVLNVKLPHLDRWTEMRQTNANRYHELFAAAGLARILKLPACAPQRRHVWNQYVVRVPDGNRDQLRAWLSEAKIGSEIYYPLGLHQQECFRYLQYVPGDLPHTECAAREVLALPIFPELTADEQRRVVDRIAAFYGAGRGGHCLAAPKFLAQRTEHSRAKVDGA